MQSFNATSRPALVFLADVSSVRIALTENPPAVCHTALPELAIAAGVMVVILTVIRLLLANWTDECHSPSVPTCTLADVKLSQSSLVTKDLEHPRHLEYPVAATQRVSPIRANPHVPRIHSKLALDAGLTLALDTASSAPVRPLSPPRFLGRATSPKSLARSLAEKSVKREIASCAAHPLAPKSCAPTPPRLSQGPTRLTLLAPPPLSLSHPFAAPTIAGCEAPRVPALSPQLSIPVHPFCAPFVVDSRPKQRLPSLTIVPTA